LISKSGPKAETVAGESSSAIRTTGLVKVRAFGLDKRERNCCHNATISL